MISPLVVILIFASAAYLTWTRGIAHAFALVYLPVMFFLSVTKSISLPMLPDMTSQFAVGYGVLAGIALRGGQRMPFRWNIIDTVMTLLWILSIISAGVVEGFEMARNTIGDGFFDFLTPYFLARAAFFSAEGRRLAFWSVTFCAVAIAMMSPIEMRLWPQFWSRILDQFGLYTSANSMPLYRFGLARAQTTFMQPMDQGNCGVIMAGFIALFAATTSIGLRNWRTLAGVGAALFVSLASLSFSAFLNVFVAVAIFGAIFFMPWLGRALAVFVIAAIVTGVGVTNHLMSVELGERDERFGQTATDSMFMRTRIVQEGWPVARDAGWTGFGKDGVAAELSSRSANKDFVKSIDNAYLLMIMQRGWPYFIVFLSIPFIIAFRTAAVWNRAPTEAQRMPLLISISVLFAILAAMYTIFFGFVYAHLWLVMLGLFASVSDVLLGRSMLESERPIAAAAPRVATTAGFPAAVGRL